MPLPPDLTDALAPHLGGPIRQAEAVGGGCIARATRVETDGGVYFLKYGRDAVAATFEAEAVGLAALREAGSPLRIPTVHAVAPEQDGRPGFLLMDWIDQAAPSPAFWDGFGHGLAALHRHTDGRYGFGRDNFIGRLPQENGWEARWPSFFRRRRLEPQVARARRQGRWPAAWDPFLDALYARLDALLPPEPPASVLHGDLWSGNALAAADGRAALIDPATYYGHREADLAMAELFGGFDARFYDAYHAAWPLEPGYPERRAVYNLYHLINHLNHFGGGYAGGVERTLRRFG